MIYRKTKESLSTFSNWLIDTACTGVEFSELKSNVRSSSHRMAAKQHTIANTHDQKYWRNISKFFQKYPKKK